MVVLKPLKIKQPSITTLDIVEMSGGLDERGAVNAAANSFTDGRNVMVNSQNLVTHRKGTKRWLPDTVGTVYQIFPVIYDGELYYLVADDGKVKYCQEGDTAWTDCGGDNEVTTNTSVMNTFVRVIDKVLVLNGADTLRYIDLATLEMVQFTYVADPSNAPTIAYGGALTSTGSAKLYYCISWNSVVGTSAISPILSTTVSKDREVWATTDFVTITRNNTAPAGAVSWNLYLATDAAGSAIASTDMLLLSNGIDINTTTFTDNGLVPIDISKGTAPSDNSTQGPTVTYGIESEGRPILYGDINDPYSIWIGGWGEYALDFSPSNGGYRAVLNDGTNYYPMSVSGFRNGQGVPSITVLFSNTQGLSKQSILEQQTVTYGNASFVIWSVTEQNYGAAGVSSPYGTVNYLGGLHYISTDGIIVTDTEASLQNVLSSRRISDKISSIMGSVKNSSLRRIVGAGWGNRVYWTLPTGGYAYNNMIIVYDITDKARPKWYTMEIRCQWLGVVSPSSESAFMYICQDNHIFRLEDTYVALDENSDGTSSPFPVSVSGPLLSGNQSHTYYRAVVQVVFYLVDFIGSIEVGVTYRNRSGKLKTKSKTISRGEYVRSRSGGWSSVGYLFNQNVTTKVKTWGDIDVISDAESSIKESIRIKLPLNKMTNEISYFVNTNLDNSSFILRSVSYEGVNLNVLPDIG